MNQFFTRFWQNLFPPARPMPAGVYPYQAPPDAPHPYRLHLRLEAGGEGVLIVNASTVLHLNQSAAEYIYYYIHGAPAHEIARQVARRYQVKYEQALSDYRSLIERLETLITTPDLDPVTYLDFERRTPYATAASAPYRLDCALTYRLSHPPAALVAPLDHVRRELDTAEWQTILEKAWRAGVPHIIFTGGEPTLRPDLIDLIAYAEKLGQVTGLLSDGLRLAETAYLHQLLQSGLDHLMLLLDPEDEQSWEALRDVLVEDVFTTVHLTITPHNAAAIPALLERLAQMGVRSLSLSASEAELKENLRAARQLAAQHQLTLSWDLAVPYSSFHPVAVELEEEAPPDGAGKAWLYVEPDGDVLPAQGVHTPLGNLLTDPWEQVWGKH